MVSERILKYITEKGISVYAFENAINVSRGTISKAIKAKNSIGSAILENILTTYTDLNPEWLLTGKGKMLREEDNLLNNKAPASPPDIVDKLFQKLEEKEKELRVQAEEIGKLKQEIAQLKESSSNSNFTHSNTGKLSSASSKSKRSGVTSADAPL